MSSRKYIGAIDLGTTSSRFIVFSPDSAIITVARKEHRQIFPQPGWVEHDASEILSNTYGVIRDALQSAGLSNTDLAAVGITNQRETTVLWDRRTGKPLYNAIVWQDTRTEDLLRDLALDGGPDRFRKLSGLPLASYFSAGKLAWLLRHVPGARALAEAGDALFGTMDSWLLWNLTGGPNGGRHVTDVSNASRTQLMNLATLQWDTALLTAFGIPAACLPGIYPSSHRHAEAKNALLLGVPLTGILGDQQAALVGQACFEVGEAKNTYGTGCFLLLNTGTQPVESQAGLLTTVAYQFGNSAACYALEGSVAVAGALVQWLRDNLQLIDSSAEIEALARQVPDNGDVYFVPAFSGLYAPHWDGTARGVIAGLTGFATRAHLARAALESTAFQTRDVIAAMEQDCGYALKSLRVDGGMVVNELLMQFQSNILDVPVVRPRTIETTALGAAYAAGLAVGYWHDLEELRANQSIAKRWTPQFDLAKRDRLYYDWQRAVQRSRGWRTF
jgi:glycerol kinase